MTASSAHPQAAACADCFLPASYPPGGTSLSADHPERSPSGGQGVWQGETEKQQNNKKCEKLFIKKKFKVSVASRLSLGLSPILSHCWPMGDLFRCVVWPN